MALSVKAAPPVITSAATANATVGQAFSYQITATSQPTSFGVQGLPAYLRVDTETGVISGTPTAAAALTLTLNAYNGVGKGSATLKVTVAEPTPVITSATTAGGTVGKPFSYQITATNSPTSYGVQGLPGGLALNASSGVIYGTPKFAGKFPLTLSAYNGGSKGSATLTLTIQPAGPPVVTSATTAAGTLGEPFSYQITATNQPTSYGVQGLTSGLALNASTGLISGTPKATGKYTLTLNADNSVGKGSATLTLTVVAAPPQVTGGTVNGTVGKAFSYQITATNSPTSYGVQGLPGGLALNASTGLIYGAPNVAGKYTLTLNAYNSIGKGSATLTLTVTSS